jgi:hypothetical protein
MFRVWQKLLDSLDEEKIWFAWKTTFSELYDRALQVQKVNVSQTGSKITVESAYDAESIYDFSFQINGYLKEEMPDDNIVFKKETKIVTIKHVLPKLKIVMYVSK